MTLLAIDQGNTRTKIGLVAQGKIQQHWIIPTEKDQQDRSSLTTLFTALQIPTHLPLAICSVVPETIARWQLAAAQWGVSCTSITGSTATPLDNRYATPLTLGPDRLMAAVAAAHLVAPPLIVMSLGTATVVDAVSIDNAYLGGMIAPGIEILMNALVDATSALPAIVWRQPELAIGRNTEESMTNGWFYATTGGLQAMVSAISASLHADLPLVLTGGWATTVAQHLPQVALVDEYLVLKGIALTLQC